MTSDQDKNRCCLPAPELKLSLATFKELASDSELLAIFVETRSREGAEQLVRRHGPMVTGVIRRMIRHSSDAEDAFQATFLILLQSATKIQKQASLSAWLYGVAYRTAYRVRQRSKQRRAIALHETDYDPLQLEDPFEKIASEAQLELLDRELNSLQSSLKEMLVEHHLLGFTAPQIAERLNISVSAVEGRLRRGRSLLRQRLARQGISFSVVLAIAAAYQKHTVASDTVSWTCHLLQSDLFSQSIVSNTLPSTDSSLQPLIQGELAMKSFFVKGATLASTAACLAVAVSAIPYFSSSTGEAIGPSIVMASVVDVDSAAPAEVSLGARTGAEPIEKSLKTIDPPGNTALANFTEANEPQPNPTNSSQGNAAQGMMGTQEAASQKTPPTIKIVPFTKPSGPLPNWMTDGGTFAEEENAAREQIRKRMRQTVRPDFNNVPLRSVIENFASEFKISMIIDTIALEGAGGATAEDPVTLTLGELSLQRALKLILDPKELCYIIEPEYIQITTKDQASARRLRTYDLAYLLPSNEKVLDLINLIMTTVAASWDIDGGEDSLVPFGSMLVANCREETHLAIEGLLFELSKMSKENFK